MTDRPIIFSGPMVRALLDGRKTQTRRLATSPLRRVEVGDRLWVRKSFRLSPDACEGWPYEARPCRGWLDYAAGGHEEVDAPDFDAVLKVAGKDVDWDCLSDRWRPSIHMPRWASRLTLIVEDVRFEQLADISDEDAQAEGICWVEPTEDDRQWAKEYGSEITGVWTVPGLRGVRGLPADIWHVQPALCFSRLWASLHAKEGERWEDNPAIVALTFRVVSENIDRIAA